MIEQLLCSRPYILSNLQNNLYFTNRDTGSETGITTQVHLTLKPVHAMLYLANSINLTYFISNKYGE